MQLLRERDAGKRLLALAIMQQDPERFAKVGARLAVERAQTSFEMFHGLSLAAAAPTLLDRSTRERIVRAATSWAADDPSLANDHDFRDFVEALHDEEDPAAVSTVA